MATEGGNVPTFCQDGAQDFYKINEKLIGIGLVAILRKAEGTAIKFSFMPPTFITMAAPLDLLITFLDHEGC